MALVLLPACAASPAQRARQAVVYGPKIKLIVVDPDNWQIANGQLAPVFKITIANLGPRTINHLQITAQLKGGLVYQDTQVLTPLVTNKYHTIPPKGGYLQFDIPFTPKALSAVEEQTLLKTAPESSVTITEIDFTAF